MFIGSRVQILDSDTYGIILEIDGDQFLILTENDGRKIWLGRDELTWCIDISWSIVIFVVLIICFILYRTLT